ncbi:hypothetical protein [Breznakibacter xylanolyticus]|uniref:hypothetical protein n=1 Tax=Breznakibacter xylanolyticus TaxID=990 RepID=UPI000DAC9B27|nr:hypothetical protein [Breznakibacter xylanolyticus]MBN2744198.1 hypothetical protein [Marinilabiliaceae bacterium]
MITHTNQNRATKLEKLLLAERRKQLKKNFYPLSIKELNKFVDDSENDFINGKASSAQDVLKQIDSWK